MIEILIYAALILFGILFFGYLANDWELNDPPKWYSITFTIIVCGPGIWCAYAWFYINKIRGKYEKDN